MDKDKKSYITEFSEEEKRLNDEATLKALTEISDAMRAERKREEKKARIKFIVMEAALLAAIAAFFWCINFLPR
jgi:hypothetical protein